LRQAKDEAERATRAKSEFLSRMSHELRTPMNAVLGFGQLLEMDDLNEEQTESVDQIMRAGRHLLELINEILDITRIESGRLHIASESVLVTPTIEECVALLRPQAHSHRVQIWHTDVASLRVQADPRRLKQILLNLLSNAIKYNQPGGTVIVTCAQLQDAPFVRFKVTDTGLGIPPEKLEHLFLPFERLHTEESAVEGSGLGLALTKRLAEAMGGSIGVESTMNEGSTFWIDLPIAESLDEATQD
jgi:signal transduction histidine kinase